MMTSYDINRVAILLSAVSFLFLVGVNAQDINNQEKCSAKCVCQKQLDITALVFEDIKTEIGNLKDQTELSINALKSQVVALSTKEIKTEIGGLQELTTLMTKEFNALKQQVANLEASNQRLMKDTLAACSSVTNLALRKPATQSTTHTTYVAGLAVDGNRDNSFTSGRTATCVHTESAVQNWWAVDLLMTATIKYVAITSYHPNYLRTFYVTAVDVSPSAVTPRPGVGKVCAYQQEGVAASTTVTLNCAANTVGRYVIVQMVESAANYLLMCEVEVYGCAV